MTDTLQDRNVVVIGLGKSGVAACRLLVRLGARVVAVDEADTSALHGQVASLEAAGVRVTVGAAEFPEGPWDMAVVSPGVATSSPLAAEARRRGIDVISEMELGYRQALCLSVAVTGTNGKTTTVELVERILTHCGRSTLAAGNIGTPICDVVEQSRHLDCLTLEVSSFQLEAVEYFRPAVAVLTNITPDHLDRYPRLSEYARAKGRIFRNQQPFDWAIVQSEALAQLRSLGVDIPSKVITYSATNRRADIRLDRGLVISQIPGWTGPLLDMDTTRLRGAHNAENVMAALAVGRVMRLPLDSMVEAVRAYVPRAHRCEVVAEHRGVVFVNDSKATNLDAVTKAIEAVPVAPAGEPNVFLIAGGQDKGFEFYDIGPLLSRRVKAAFLLGRTREKIRAAWSLFTPCTLVDSLLEAVLRAAESAVAGDVVLLSPACSSFDMFQNYQHRGEVFRDAVRQWVEGTGRGALPGDAIDGGTPVTRTEAE